MDLREFISAQEDAGRVKRVRVPVDPQLEVAALCRREFSTGDAGRLLIFEDVEGSSIPLAANLFGDKKRIAQVLRSNSLDDFAQRLATLLHSSSGTANQRLKHQVGYAQPPQQINPFQYASDIDLRRLPFIRSWPGEVRPYLTLGLLLTRHPETKQQNLGLYRVQLLEQKRLAINFAAGSGADEHLQVAKKLQQPLPAALIFGGDPAWIWAAAAPLPSDCDEFTFCQSLFEYDPQFSACSSQPLSVPSAAEIVIEGEFHPVETCHEGPFGNHTGRYVSRADCPVLRVTALGQRSGAIMPITVVGPPPSENVYLGKANEIFLRELLKIDYPQISDLRMPIETIFHGVSLLCVTRQTTAATRELIESLWKNSPLQQAKVMILLDEDIDLASFAACWWRSINQLSPDRIYTSGKRIAIDATGVDPAALVMENQQTLDLLARRSREYNL